MGSAAVERALAGESGVMVTIDRQRDEPYQWRVGSVALEQVANVEKKMPPSFIDDSGFHITPACRRYLAPLIAGEDPPPFRNGMPDYVRLQNTPVVRRLPPYP